MLHLTENNIIENYKGPKLVYVVTGGGIGIHRIAQTPGASNILHAIQVPYSYEELVRFISSAWLTTFPDKGIKLGQEYKNNAVSKRGAQILCEAAMRIWPYNRVIVCSAATTTKRLRKGKNQAFVAMGDPVPNSNLSIKHYHLMLPDSNESFSSEEQRKIEDEKITQFLYKITLNTMK